MHVKTKAVERILAGRHGMSGILREELIDLTNFPPQELEHLMWTPASGFIGTSRIKPLVQSEIGRLEAVVTAHDVGFFLNIGGNGTIKQSMQISESLGDILSVSAIPKTVDNDLGDQAFRQVHYTPGFPSCANYWKHKIFLFNQENLGACEHDKVLVAQTFGRKTGFLAACARLADKGRDLPLILLLPEDQTSLDTVLDRIDRLLTKHGRAMVVTSEGYDVGTLDEAFDLSGQIMYGSSRTTAAQILVNRCMDHGIQARAFIPGFDQRCETQYTVGTDIERAFDIGRFAVQNLEAGRKDFLASISRENNEMPISMTAVPFSETRGYSRVMPARWIRNGAFDVTDDFIAYCDDLVQRQDDSFALPRRGIKFSKPVFANVVRKLPQWAPPSE